MEGGGGISQEGHGMGERKKEKVGKKRMGKKKGGGLNLQP